MSGLKYTLGIISIFIVEYGTGWVKLRVSMDGEEKELRPEPWDPPTSNK